MKQLKTTIAIALALGAATAQAAGPLRLAEVGGDLQPLRWDMSNGPIPVYTDGGEAFTYDFDGTTVFLSIERANEITEFAFNQWNAVPTSTFEAEIAGTIEGEIGIADVTGDNADEMYGVLNGYGFWVLYDTDGSIIEDVFGAPKTSVLGVAFPEWSDGNGNIIEATAVMNGYAVNVNDPNGDQAAGVFTHEFGHAINLAHTQVNGHLAYYSYTYAPEFPGVEGCVEPVHRWDYPIYLGANNADPAIIETMYPFINSGSVAAIEQSTVEHPDDVASISQLYPTSDYEANTGSISGVLTLKDGKTEYTGINVVARNVNDPLNDAVSSVSGDLTQGLIGPDGRYTINNLTPGEDYVVYIERIVAGGFSTPASQLVSQAEYWNAGESNDPVTDGVCDATPITAQAGVTQQADIVFNGYEKGVQYTPIVSAFLTDMSKNGRSALGQAGRTSFKWDFNKGFIVLPEPFVASGSAGLNRNGQKMLVQYDFNGNGIQQAAIFDWQGSRRGRLIPMGDLGDGTCGGGSSSGVNSTSGWALNDDGDIAVGLGYLDQDGNGSCQQSFSGEIVPWIWDEKGGIRQLDMGEFADTAQFVRAQAISGDGSVVLGLAGFGKAVAWVNEGPIIDLKSLYGARDAYASTPDGTRVALETDDDGVVLWNAHTGEAESIGSLAWCDDVPAIRFGRDFCEMATGEEIEAAFGPVQLTPFDSSDDGSVIVGRGGSFFSGFYGGLWVEDIGWMTMADFLYRQGVAEAFDLPMDNPIALSGDGTQLMGGLAGATFTWLVDMDQVYVCQGGKSILVGFPNGLRAKIAQGAELGRCEFID